MVGRLSVLPVYFIFNNYANSGPARAAVTQQNTVRVMHWAWS